jgi:hypothetical protein
VKPRRLAATESRFHFGELVDEVSRGRHVAEVERADGYIVVVEPARDLQPNDVNFDAEAWLANLGRIQEQIRAYRAANPDAATRESTVEILRELRDDR